MTFMGSSPGTTLVILYQADNQATFPFFLSFLESNPVHLGYRTVRYVAHTVRVYYSVPVSFTSSLCSSGK
jgi:hypothetical protein